MSDETPQQTQAAIDETNQMSKETRGFTLAPPLNAPIERPYGQTVAQHPVTGKTVTKPGSIKP